MTNPSQAHIPDPLREHPPADRFCDLVLNGGVASGVVYPWAVLHLARHFHFRSLGGNSVGAMAAALAAAAEYGRRRGLDDAFEPLRQLPLKLAQEEGGRARMLRLFQPAPPLRRLFEAFVRVFGSDGDDPDAPRPGPPAPRRAAWLDLLGLYGAWVTLGAAAALLSLLVALLVPDGRLVLLLPLAWAAALPVALLALLLRLAADLRRLRDNGWGLCTGLGQALGEEGLVEWLHQGIQRSAGRRREDAPLSFADLWSAPLHGRPGPVPGPGGTQPEEPSIELQMFTSNVTLGRPFRLPLQDPGTRLYFDVEEWRRFFPPTVLGALVAASEPYRPRSGSDPAPEQATPDDPALVHRLRLLPAGGMPVVVAARLSMSFPLLFSCVPVYAVDYENRRAQRQLRRCLLSDGGLCTNFPIHLFDRSHPDWPTFAILFDKRLRAYRDESVWMAPTHLKGRADSWQRGVPGAEDEPGLARPPLTGLLGLAGGILLTMKDWNDRMTMLLPQVRARVVRLGLRPGEGQLNIAMRGSAILRMAHEYGTGAGRLLVARYGAGPRGQPSQAWREQLYVRALTELRSLRRHLAGYGASARSRAHTVPLRELLRDATAVPPLQEEPAPGTPPRPAGATGACLDAAEAASLERAIDAVEALERTLDATRLGPYEPVPEPELRQRPPV